MYYTTGPTSIITTEPTEPWCLLEPILHTTPGPANCPSHEVDPARAESAARTRGEFMRMKWVLVVVTVRSVKEEMVINDAEEIGPLLR